MSTEECAVCGEVVGFHHTVHVMFHTGGDEGVVDHYVCRQCYDDDLAPLFEAGVETEAEEQRATPDEPDELVDDEGEPDGPDEPDELADDEGEQDEPDELADDEGEEATPDE